jgi:arylsulfatase A-like enzyme
VGGGPTPFGADGRDLLAAPLTDEAEERSLIAASPGGRAFAVRRGDWKLVRQRGEPSQLFDVVHDPGETLDRAGERPELASAMEDLLAAWGVPSASGH